MDFLDKLSEKNTVALAKNLIPNLYKITSNEKVSVTLEEYKLFFTYLSKINPMQKIGESKKMVVFTKKDYEKLLGVKRIRNETMKKIADGLFNMSFCCQGETQIEEVKFRLFDSCSAGYDNNGEYVIAIQCSQKSEKLFFDVTRFGYISSQLKNLIYLSSNYTVSLYCLILTNAYKKEFCITVDELKKYLRCENKETYDTYKNFNKLLLKKSVAEINAKTNLTVEYKAGTKSGSKGNKVTGIIFRIIRKDNMVFSDSLQDSTETTLADADILSEINEACGNSLKDGQAQCLYDAAAAIDRDYLKQITGCEDRTQAIVKVIQNKYHLAELYGADNPYSYVTTLLKEEQGREKTTHSQPNKTELQTKASYDIDELEKRDTFSDLNRFL